MTTYDRIAAVPGWEGLLDACRILHVQVIDVDPTTVSTVSVGCPEAGCTGRVAPASPWERLGRLLEALERQEHCWWNLSRNDTPKGFGSNIVFRLHGKIREGGTTLANAPTLLAALEQGVARALGIDQEIAQ